MTITYVEIGEDTKTISTTKVTKSTETNEHEELFFFVIEIFVPFVFFVVIYVVVPF